MGKLLPTVRNSMKNKKKRKGEIDFYQKPMLRQISLPGLRYAHAQFNASNSVLIRLYHPQIYLDENDIDLLPQQSH